MTKLQSQKNVESKSHSCRQLLSKEPTCRQCGTTNQTLSPGFKPATSLPTSLTTPVMEVVTGYDLDDISNDHDYDDDDDDDDDDEHHHPLHDDNEGGVREG